MTSTSRSSGEDTGEDTGTASTGTTSSSSPSAGTVGRSRIATTDETSRHARRTSTHGPVDLGCLSQNLASLCDATPGFIAAVRIGRGTQEHRTNARPFHLTRISTGISSSSVSMASASSVAVLSRHPRSFSAAVASSVMVPRTLISTVGHWSAGHAEYGVVSSAIVCVGGTAPPAPGTATTPSDGPSGSTSQSPSTSSQNDASAFALVSLSLAPWVGDDDPPVFKTSLATAASWSYSTSSIAARSMLPACEASTSAMTVGSIWSNVRSRLFCSVWYAHRRAAARRGALSRLDPAALSASNAAISSYRPRSTPIVMAGQKQRCLKYFECFDAFRGIAYGQTDRQTQKNRNCFHPGSNRRPFACKANVITNYTMET